MSSFHFCKEFFINLNKALENSKEIYKIKEEIQKINQIDGKLKIRINPAFVINLSSSRFVNFVIQIRNNSNQTISVNLNKHITKLTVGQKTTNAPNGQNPLIIDIEPFTTIDILPVGPVEIDEGILKSGKLEVTQSVLLKYGLNRDNLSFDLTGAIILKYECLQKESCWELKLLEAQVV